MSGDSPSHVSTSSNVSWPAVLLTLVAVAGAVLFGIYGPSVAGRSGLGGGLPLGDLVDAAAAHVNDAVVVDLQQTDASDLAVEEARGLIQRHLGRASRPPDLESMGYALRQVLPVSPPGAAYRGVGVLYRGRAEQAGKWLLLLLTPDDGQYLTFDSLGRPRPLVPDTTYDGELPARPGGPGAALAWSDGTLLHVVCVEDAAEADRVRDALDAP